MTPGRRVLFGLIALVIMPLLAFGLLEAGLRLAGYGYDTSFFKKMQIDGRDYFVNNDKFVLRFFPPQLTRLPEPIRMEAQKPPNTRRIFVLGESAALGDPAPPYGAWRYLRALLNDRFPNENFEVVNVSITAINSHVILPIARECAEHEGDFWIVYMGNNEMVGPFGAASVFGAQAPPVWTVRLSLALQKTRVGQWLMNTVRGLKFSSGKSADWHGMEMFVGNQVPPDDPRKERVYRNFQQNLHDILKAGLDSGARVLLNTVAVNQRDCSPFGSMAEDDPQLAVRAAAAQGQGQDGEAARLFEQAAQLQPHNAAVQYAWAQSLERLTNFPAAREHYQKACDDDTLPFRTDSRLNDIIRQAGKEMAGPNLLMLDAAAALAANNPDGICGDETFLEHVHFNFDGNYRLARLWAASIAPSLPELQGKGPAREWLSQGACEQRLALTDWNRAQLISELLRRRHKAPLNTQVNNVREMTALTNQLEFLEQEVDVNAAARARALYVADIKRSPDDFVLYFNYGDFLDAMKDWANGAAVWKQAEMIIPFYYMCYFQEGRMLENERQLDDAESAFRKTVELYPRMASAWFELSNIHTSEAKYEAALQELNHALEIEPDQASFYICKGTLLARMERHAAAIEQFRRAIEIEPDHWDVQVGLAEELSRAGRIPDASAQFGEVVRRWPDAVQGRMAYGQFLLQQGSREQAAEQFQAVLRLDPSNQAARQALGGGFN